MLYQIIGLTTKVNKHIQAGNLDKAAFYFVARCARDGKPEPGSAESEDLSQLKAAGYRFHTNNGDVVCEKPNGKLYQGREALDSWLALFG